MIDLFQIGCLAVLAAAYPFALRRHSPATIGTLVLAAPFWIARSSMPTWQALVIGFVLFNVVAVAAILGWAFISFDWVVGLLWFMLKTYGFVFTFVWMRGTLPRVRIDQLMGFAWKWLLPASLLNLFVTAGAIVVLNR